MVDPDPAFDDPDSPAYVAPLQTVPPGRPGGRCLLVNGAPVVTDQLLPPLLMSLLLQHGQLAVPHDDGLYLFREDPRLFSGRRAYAEVVDQVAHLKVIT